MNQSCVKEVAQLPQFIFTPNGFGFKFFDTLFVLFLFSGIYFSILAQDLFIFGFQFMSLVLKTLTFSLKSIDPRLLLFFVSASLEGLSHSKSYRAFVQILIVCMDHLVFVSDSYK